MLIYDSDMIQSMEFTAGGGIFSMFISFCFVLLYNEIFLKTTQAIIIFGGIISLIGTMYIINERTIAIKIIVIGAFISLGASIVFGIGLGMTLGTAEVVGAVFWSEALLGTGISASFYGVYLILKNPDSYIKRFQPDETKNILEIKKIYHYYDKARALEEINLIIEKNALISVIGPNGAGKSTLLRVISGLEEPDRGKILFMGERIDGLDAHKIAKMGIAHCPERRRLFYEMTVLENLKLGGKTLKDNTQKKSLLNFVFEIFPRLKERQKQQAGTLSGGEQQMLALGRAIMSKPRLLLLDEPSLGLAPKIKDTIFDAIEKIKKEGTTTLLVEQDAVLAMNVSDYIHVLEEGKIEMRGTKKELEKEPRIKKVYLGI